MSSNLLAISFPFHGILIALLSLAHAESDSVPLLIQATSMLD